MENLQRVRGRPSTSSESKGPYTLSDLYKNEKELYKNYGSKMLMMKRISNEDVLKGKLATQVVLLRCKAMEESYYAICSFSLHA
jgi:hypothetical protein